MNRHLVALNKSNIVEYFPTNGLKFAPFFFGAYCIVDSYMTRDIWKYDMGGQQKQETKAGVQMRGRQHVFSPTTTHPSHGGSDRNGSSSNGLHASPVQSRRNGRNDCGNAFFIEGLLGSH